ncbi:hypothetical protein SEVIR_4G276050v4 [Setaria viridis]
MAEERVIYYLSRPPWAAGGAKDRIFGVTAVVTNHGTKPKLPAAGAPRRWCDGEAVPGSAAARAAWGGVAVVEESQWEGVPAGLGRSARRREAVRRKKGKLKRSGGADSSLLRPPPALALVPDTAGTARSRTSPGLPAFLALDHDLLASSVGRQLLRAEKARSD